VARRSPALAFKVRGFAQAEFERRCVPCDQLDADGLRSGADAPVRVRAARSSPLAQPRLDANQLPVAHAVRSLLFYDPATATYIVDRWLADVRERFGGVDAILIWPTYTNLGIDDRNGYDMIRSMPGGISAIRTVVHSAAPPRTYAAAAHPVEALSLVPLSTVVSSSLTTPGRAMASRSATRGGCACAMAADGVGRGDPI
jgi:hypothetical protein